MIAYSMLGADDIARARTFYDPLIAALGGRVIDAYTSEKRVWYGRENVGLLVITQPYDGAPATSANGSMVAFSVASQADVRSIHALALTLGATNDGDPGTRTAPFFGAYFRDPNGHKLCVFTLNAS